jgi:hypothetical protein
MEPLLLSINIGLSVLAVTMYLWESRSENHARPRATHGKNLHDRMEGRVGPLLPPRTRSGEEGGGRRAARSE